MGPCDQYGMEAQLYFDDELKARELEEFHMHLLECLICQNYLEQASELSEALHSSRPLFTASDELVERVAKITTQSRPLSKASGLVRTHIWHPLRRSVQIVGLSALQWRALAVAVLFIVISLTLVPTWTWHVGAASYADAALRTHDSYLAGNLPPEVLSSSPEKVTAWFGGKVPFSFRLPASQPAPEDQRAYRLVGARLVKYRDEYAALVVYEMQTSKISLMVTSDKSAVAAGGDEVKSGELTFHYHVKNGMNVITWSTHGLTYALVSSVQGSVKGSCLVCHQNMGDQNKFEATH